MSPSTNQYLVFLQVGCPSCRPTYSVKALKGNKQQYTYKKPRLTERTVRAWFSRLLRQPARKWSGSILTTPEPALGPDSSSWRGRDLCDLLSDAVHSGKWSPTVQLVHCGWRRTQVTGDWPHDDRVRSMVERRTLLVQYCTSLSTTSTSPSHCHSSNASGYSAVFAIRRLQVRISAWATSHQGLLSLPSLQGR